MNEMVTFKNEQFGWNLRSFLKEGEPCFWLKDAVEILNLSNPRSSAALLDDDEKGVHNMDTPGGRQEVSYVTEAGLYTLVLKSRKQEAKSFRRWITHDVIPSIRKHGIYATPQTIDNIINDPDFGIRLLTELKNERNKRIELEAQREADKPKVDFADALLVCDNCSYIEELAKQLCQIGMKTGRNRLIAEMADDGFLCVRNGVKNMPTQKCVEAGWLVIERKPHIEGERSVMGFTTKVTPSGMQHFMAFYMRKHGLMPLLTTVRQVKRSITSGSGRNNKCRV